MWYLTLHRWVGDPRPAIAEKLSAHLAWMGEQQLAGRVLIAGPAENREVGIIVLGHMPRAAVDDLLRTEPFIAGGHRGYEVFAWDVHHLLGVGGFDVSAVTAMTEWAHRQLPESAQP